MTALKSFPPEICSLICRDPILKRRDLNSSCFISHTFRKEAQRLLSHRFPWLRGANRVKSWCLSLKRTPRLALNIQDLVLLLPPQSSFQADDIARLIQALRLCVNLKELTVLSQERRRGPGPQDYSTSIYMLNNLPLLTKFVNDYFAQNSFGSFLESQKMLETLELYLGEPHVYQHALPLPPSLKTVACPPYYFALGGYYGAREFLTIERLRLDFENSTAQCEIDVLNPTFTFIIGRLKSLAIFSKQRSDGKHSHFLEIMDFVAEKAPNIKHLQIHQFLPALEESDLLFSIKSDFLSIETLVLRPPPCLPKKSGHKFNLCAYVALRTACGRRKAAEEIMGRFKTLTRLVFVDHDYDYDFRRDLKTSIITGEELITLDEQEWALV